jgi:hypothetical protein
VVEQVQTISINNIQLTSRNDRQSEAKFLIKQIPANSTVVNVYRAGLGDLQRRLLKNEKLRLLTVFS